MRALSGGNRQKVLIGGSPPRLFIASEPTRGADVGARSEIYAVADRLETEGAGFLVISSELDELMGICDRIAVMSRGEVVATFDCDACEQHRIFGAAFREPIPGAP